MAWIISDVGRLYKGTCSTSMESLCFFQADSETLWPKIFLDSAMAAKWHDRWRFHPHGGQYKWSSAQPGQLWAMILAFDSTVLGQELEMVPGFLISHQSCAWNSHSSATAVCHVRTVRRLLLRVDPPSLWMALYTGASRIHHHSLYLLITAQAVKRILNGRVWPLRPLGLPFPVQSIHPRSRPGASPQNCSVSKISRRAHKLYPD